MPAIGMISWSALASIRVVGSSTGVVAGPVRARERAPSRAGCPGSVPAVPVGMHRGLGPCRPAGECNKALDRRVKLAPEPTADMQRPDMRRRVREARRRAPTAAPILPDL